MSESKTPNESVSPSTREFRLAPEYRRCAVYVILGFGLVIPLLAPLVVVARPGRNPPNLWVGAVVAIAMVPIFFWRLRIDEHGISRKRLWRWHLWPWEAFREGKVRRVSLETFEWPEQWPWNRLLVVAFLRDADQKLLLGLIEAVLSPPLPCEVPEEIRVSYGFRRSMTLTEHRVHLRKGNVCRDYHWESVLSLRIVRAARQCVAFSRLELSVGPERIQLDKDRYRGACPEAIEAFLRQYVAGERIELIATSGVPQTQSELEYRAQQLDRQLLEYQRLRLFFWTTWLSGVVGAFIWVGPGMGLLLVCGGLPTALIIRDLIVRNQRKRTELESYCQSQSAT